MKIRHLILVLILPVVLFFAAGFAGEALAADYYAEAKAAGHSDAYAAAYNTAKREGEYDTTAAAYAQAKESGRTDLYAYSYAQAVSEGHSHAYAAFYAEMVVRCYIEYIGQLQGKDRDLSNLDEDQLNELLYIIGEITPFDPYGGWQGFIPQSAFFVAQRAAREVVDNRYDPQADLAAQAERLKTNLAAYFDAQAWHLVTGGQIGPGTNLVPPNLNIVNIGDGLTLNSLNAAIEGVLQSTGGFAGTYSFNVNLASGAISNGAMSGQIGTMQTYDLAGGMGVVTGANFSVTGMNGSVLDGVPNPATGGLSGEASKGFGKLGDIGVINGLFNVNWSSHTEGGAIVSGQRIK